MKLNKFKKIIILLVLLIPLATFSQPVSSSSNSADLYNMSFGKYGCLNINDTDWHTGKWGLFQADTVTVIDTAIFKNYNTTTRNWVNDSVFNITIPAGTIKFWQLFKIKLASGYGTAYNEKQ